MQVRVTLPSGSMIEYRDFYKAIAEVVCPTGEQDLEGIDCVVGKVIPRYLPIPTPIPVATLSAQPVNSRANPFWSEMQSVLTSEAGRTLDELLLPDQPDAAASGTVELPFAEPPCARYQRFEISQPEPLTDEDSRALEKLLPNLPPLRYPMSEDEADAFMAAYVMLPNRPAWKPVLISAEIFSRRKVRQDAEMRGHEQRLQNEFARELSISVTGNPVRGVMPGAGYFIPRNQAIAYLERHGFAHSDMVTGDDRDAAELSKQETPPESQEQVTPPEPTGGKQSAFGQQKLSDDQRREVVKRRDELEAQRVKAFVKQTAEEFGIDRRYVYELWREAEAEKALRRIDQQLAAGSR